jgi:GT2 family glycosyltransferase
MLTVNVVIPCKNEQFYIEECITAIFNSKLSDGVKINVIAVDGNSSDNTKLILNQLKVKFESLYILDNIKEITPVAFNIGVKFSKCDFIQIVGARMIITDDYIQTAINILQKDDNIWCVGGRLVNSFLNNKSKAIASALDSQFAVGAGNFRVLKKSNFVDTVSCPMFRFRIFENIGLFDERLIRNQDDDLSYRILKHGGKIWFESSISYKYYSRSTLKHLFFQYFQYGFWKVYVNKKHKSITTIRQLFPILFIFYIFILSLFILLGKFFLLLIFPLFFYFLLICFISIYRYTSFSTFYFVPLVYPIVHFSYGIGYLKGIVDFVVLKKSPLKMSKKLSR